MTFNFYQLFWCQLYISPALPYYFLLEVKRVMTYFPLHMYHPSSTTYIYHLITEKHERSLALYDSRGQHK